MSEEGERERDKEMGEEEWKKGGRGNKKNSEIREGSSEEGRKVGGK